MGVGREEIALLDGDTVGALLGTFDGEDKDAT